MIIDEKRQLIIFGNRKCGSTTLKTLFGEFATLKSPFLGRPPAYSRIRSKGVDRKTTRVEKAYFRQWFKHMPAHKLETLFGILDLDFASFRKVVCIRDPYERARSEWRWSIKNKPNEGARKQALKRGHDVFLLTSRLLHECALNNFTGVHDGLYEARGFHIVRLEHLQQDMAEALDGLPDAAPLLDKLNGSLVQENRTEQASEALKLSPLTRQHIESVFAEDFRVGGYTKQAG